MENTPGYKRGYQADVHFALGAVIQGVTVAALGGEIAFSLKNFILPDTLWILATGLLSFLVVLTFWVSFLNNYFFGFRVIVLNAKMHVLYSAQYLLLGLLQLVAINFLDNPRMWLTFLVLLFLVAILGSWYLFRSIVIVDDENIRQALEYDPGEKILNILFLVVLLILFAWYVFPALDTPLYHAAALTAAFLTLAVFNLNFIKVFQRHLETA
jgi:hypothetical protein